MYKFFISFCVFTASAAVLMAQQLPLFTQYRENLGLINPASVNSDFFTNQKNLSFGASYRIQWTSLKNAPQTQTLRAEYLTTGNSLNLLTGGYIINDKTGPTGFSGLYGRIGGVLSEDPQYGGISAGLNLGVVQYRVNAGELHLRDANDVLGTENQSKIYPDAGLGVFAWQQLSGGSFDNDYVYGGVSVPQLFGLDLAFKDDKGEFHTKRVQHFYAQAGFYHFLSDESFIEPSLWIKYVPNAPLNIDLNIRYQLSDSFWFGAGVSSQANIHAEAGVLIGSSMGYDNDLRIGYGFDYSISSFGPSAGSTHEINITFALDQK